ncbi:hypothetical protein [Azospirillum rugosum]|uniref:Uncharacterized protein n=1 Tax=Azospirillum rugosum TaxID=416170 RepID=A0ABS4SJT7_9PROT|nr:hypothetical protein [Azospirillum rugosum]MBP2292821.1 hypothetical protein [Azospirillum rugosum]MDQ0527080.1 hypothetical protein [Azospirillum rugosum]
MQKTHSLERLVVVVGVALASLLTVAASAAVHTEAAPAAAPSHIDWQAITDTANQQFYFN